MTDKTRPCYLAEDDIKDVTLGPLACWFCAKGREGPSVLTVKSDLEKCPSDADVVKSDLVLCPQMLTVQAARPSFVTRLPGYVLTVQTDET